MRPDPQRGAANRHGERLRPPVHHAERTGDDHDAGRVDGADVLRREEQARDVGREDEERRQDDDGRRGHAEHVAADACEDDVPRPALPVSRLLGEEDQARGGGDDGERLLRRHRGTEVRHLPGRRYTPEHEQRERRRQGDHAGCDARLRDEREDAAPLGAERDRQVLWEAAVRDPAGGADGRRRDDLRRDHRRDRRREAMRSGDRDRAEPERHRYEEEERAHVVAAAQNDRDSPDVLGALRKRDEGADGRPAGRGAAHLPQDASDRSAAARIIPT